jgi:cell wall-associated NlpC family hydrolase
MGSALRVAGEAENGYVPVWPHGYVRANSVRENSFHYSDLAAVAAMLAGTPYQWGGRSSYGIDCSGLVQLVCAMCGVNVPRDTDQQMDVVGVFVGDDIAAAQRGDIIYCTEGDIVDHVAIAVGDNKIIHASASRGGVVVNDVAEWFPEKLRVLAVRRLV